MRAVRKRWGEEGDSFLTLAFARTDGGMTLSGLKACRGSTKEVRILPHFLHSDAIDDGRGLLIPMAAGWAGALSKTCKRRLEKCWVGSALDVY
jgi:hypothetical protein